MKTLIIISFAFCFSLAACGNGSKSVEDETEEKTKAIVIEKDDGTIDTLLVVPNKKEE